MDVPGLIFTCFGIKAYCASDVRSLEKYMWLIIIGIIMKIIISVISTNLISITRLTINVIKSAKIDMNISLGSIAPTAILKYTAGGNLNVSVMIELVIQFVNHKS